MKKNNRIDNVSLNENKSTNNKFTNPINISSKIPTNCFEVDSDLNCDSKINNNNDVIISQSSSKTIYNNQFCVSKKGKVNFIKPVKDEYGENVLEGLEVELKLIDYTIINAISYRWDYAKDFKFNYSRLQNAVYLGSEYCFN